MSTQIAQQRAPHRLPQEIFGHIFKHLFADLAYQNDSIVDYILTFGPELRNETRSIIKELHGPDSQVTVYTNTQKEFGTRRLRELLKIKKISLSAYSTPPRLEDNPHLLPGFNGWLSLRSNLILLMNNLQVIEINTRNFIHDIGGTDDSCLVLASASRCQIKRIIVKLPAFHEGTMPWLQMNFPADDRHSDENRYAEKYRADYAAPILMINNNFNVTGAMMRVVPFGVEETWFWDRMDGESLCRCLNCTEWV